MSTPPGSEPGRERPAAPGKQQKKADGDVRLWPIGVSTLVFVLLGIVAAQPLGYWLGTAPDGAATREGTAQIESCEPSWSQLYLVQVCTAQVRWERSLSTRTPRNLDGPPVERSVYSLESLSGTVQVVDRCPSREDHCRTVPADHPDRGGLTFVPIVLCIALGIVGLIIGLKFSSRRPRRPAAGSAETTS